MHCGDDKQYYDSSGTIGIDDGGQAEQKYQQASGLVVTGGYNRTENPVPWSKLLSLAQNIESVSQDKEYYAFVVWSMDLCLTPIGVWN